MTTLYLSPTELQNAPTGIAWSALFQGAGQPQNGLLDLCLTVSDLIDGVVKGDVFGPQKEYVLAATQDTEMATTSERERCMIDDAGNLTFRATFRPIVQVVAAQYQPLAGNGLLPAGGQQWLTQDSGQLYFEGRDIVFIGPFRRYAAGGQALRASVTYVDGFPNCLLTASAAVGAMSVTVDDPTGITAGSAMTIYDYPAEPATVAASYTGGTTVPLAAPLAYAHAAGLRFSALPHNLKQAAIWLAQSVIQQRAQEGVMPVRNVRGGSGGGPGQAQQAPGPSEYYDMAMRVLEKYTLW